MIVTLFIVLYSQRFIFTIFGKMIISQMSITCIFKCRKQKTVHSIPCIPMYNSNIIAGLFLDETHGCYSINISDVRTLYNKYISDVMVFNMHCGYSVTEWHHNTEKVTKVGLFSPPYPTRVVFATCNTIFESLQTIQSISAMIKIRELFQIITIRIHLFSLHFLLIDHR